MRDEFWMPSTPEERDRIDRYEPSEAIWGPEIMELEVEEESWGAFDEEQEQADLTKLSLLIDRLEAQRAEIAEIAKTKSLMVSVEEDLENQIKAILLSSGRKRFEGSNKLVSLVEKCSFKVPKSPEDKEALRKYCLENNLDYLLTVNSGSLNEWLNEEKRLAEENGGQFGIVPGLEEPKIYYDLSIRAKKK